MTSSLGFDRYLQTRRAEIDAALEAALPTPPDCPPLIAEAMRYSLFAGGKRLRPILTLAAAEAVVNSRHTDGRSRDAGMALALPAACAVELIHTYSLVHDDLPAMDDDGLRRGRATAHVVYGEGVAILAGDALLTHAFVVLARRRSDTPPGFDQRRLRAVARVAEAAGAAGMVGGQVLDLAATRTLPAGVFGPVDLPPCNRHLVFPLRAAFWQGVPRRVLARQRLPGQSRPKRVALPASISGRWLTEFTGLLRH